MEEIPSADEKPINQCLFPEEKPGVQTLQIKEEPLDSAYEYDSSCSPKPIDWNVDLKQDFTGENDDTHSQPVEVKTEPYETFDDSDLTQAEQNERDLNYNANTKEELCIARLQAYVKAHSSTCYTQCDQTTERIEDVDRQIIPQNLIGFNESEDFHMRPQEQAATRDRDYTSLAESENLPKTLSQSAERQLGSDKSGRQSTSSGISTGNQDTNPHSHDVNYGESYATVTDLEIRTQRAGDMKTPRDELGCRPTKTIVSVDVEKLQQDSDTKGRCHTRGM
ncbi:hypothetical protein ElyMa_002315700 [Elysia marginata]|uniref:Uncharacterized protein n=1 Tax=Elysia marginata TaxID=1093978 RepID=A0AAV4G492_9GAST|nr:hypothetical protein ElyMa_002315700 [Elysia marginata]